MGKGQIWISGWAVAGVMVLYARPPETPQYTTCAKAPATGLLLREPQINRVKLCQANLESDFGLDEEVVVIVSAVATKVVEAVVGDNVSIAQTSAAEEVGVTTANDEVFAVVVISKEADFPAEALAAAASTLVALEEATNQAQFDGFRGHGADTQGVTQEVAHVTIEVQEHAVLVVGEETVEGKVSIVAPAACVGIATAKVGKAGEDTGLKVHVEGVANFSVDGPFVIVNISMTFPAEPGLFDAIDIAKLVCHFEIKVESTNHASSAEANSVDVNSGAVSQNFGQGALIVTKENPVGIQCHVFNTDVAAIDSVEIDVVITKITDGFGQFGGDGVNVDIVIGECQTQSVKGQTGEAIGVVIGTNEHLAAKSEFLTSNASAQGCSPEVVGFNVGLVQGNIAASTVVSTGEIVGTEAFAPEAIAIEFDEGEDVLGEVSFDVQACALFDIAGVFKGIHVEIVTANADAAAEFNVLKFGKGNAAKAHYEGSNQECSKTHVRNLHNIKYR